MKPTITKIILTTALAGATLGAPIIPVDVPLVGEFTTKARVETHRTYLRERAEYYNTFGMAPRYQQEAAYARDAWETKLLTEGFVDAKNGQIKEKATKRESLFETIVAADWVARAYAYTFGKEDFESCGAIPCTFTSDDSYGSGAFALDATSKVNGTDSARCDIGGVDSGCVLTKTLTSASTYYVQMTVFIPTGWTFGASGYFALFNVGDGTGSPVYCNLENYGTIRITCGGDELGYTDTGLNVALNTKTKLEFRIKVSASAGDVDIWLNNNTEGSPNYNGSGSLNTGTQNITSQSIGGYHPDTVNDKYYDDSIVNTSFIGDSTPAAIEATSTPHTYIGEDIYISRNIYIGL